MPFADLTLASATLSGGARLAAASDGLPQRITVALDVHQDNVIGVTTSGVVFDPDGLHLWACGPNSIRKIRISDGAIVTTITDNSSDGGTRLTTNPQHITRQGSSIYVALSTNAQVAVIDTNTLVCRIYGQSVATVAAPAHALSGEAGKLWLKTPNNNSGSFVEFATSGSGDAATITPTGRSIAALWDMCSPSTSSDGFVYFVQSGNVVARYNLATSVSTSVSAVNSSYPRWPQYGAEWRGCTFDPIRRRVVVWNNGSSDWWGVNADTMAASSIEQYFGHAHFGGPTVLGGSSSYARQLVAWSDDGARIAFAAPRKAATGTALDSVRVVNIGPQRARWTWTAPGPCVVRRLFVPGDLANARSPIESLPSLPSFLTATRDHRKTRIYYSTDGGANRTEYQGDRLALALAAGAQITFDIEFTLSPEKLLGPRPWVADSIGGGPSIYYDVPAPRHRLLPGGL